MVACGILVPQPGIESILPALKVSVLTTDHQGSPKCIFDLSYLQQIASFSKFGPTVSPKDLYSLAHHHHHHQEQLPLTMPPTPCIELSARGLPEFSPFSSK